MSDLFFFKDDEMIHRAKAKPWKASKAAKFQDPFTLNYTDIEPEWLDDSELLPLRKSVFVFDVECFINYFMVAFRSLDNSKVEVFEHPLNIPKLKWFLENFCIVGYNSKGYDVPMLSLALTGASTKQLFNASCEIIQGGLRYYDFYKKFKVKEPRWDHIDLIEVAPLAGSLKLYAGRLHTARMQDLPIDPMAPVAPEDRTRISNYCINDLASTVLLLDELTPAMTLRCQMSAEYSVDLRSKSDAQIAEAVISSELAKLQGEKCKRPEVTFESHQYKIPAFVQYRSPQLREMLEVVRNARFTLDGLGYIDMPPEIGELSLSIGQCVYKMGVGGLHSTEKTSAYVSDEQTMLLDVDVESYYPSIILNQRLYPKHLGRPFLTVYQDIVTRRLDAKHKATQIKEEMKAIREQLKVIP